MKHYIDKKKKQDDQESGVIPPAFDWNKLFIRSPFAELSEDSYSFELIEDPITSSNSTEVESQNTVQETEQNQEEFPGNSESTVQPPLPEPGNPDWEILSLKEILIELGYDEADVRREFAAINKGVGPKTMSQWIKKSLINGWRKGDPVPDIKELKVTGEIAGVPVIEAFSYNDAFAYAAKNYGTGATFYWQRKISGKLFHSGTAYASDTAYRNYKENINRVNEKIFDELLTITGDKASYEAIKKKKALSDKLLSEEFVTMVRKAEAFFYEEKKKGIEKEKQVEIGNVRNTSIDANGEVDLSRQTQLSRMHDMRLALYKPDGVMDTELWAWVSNYSMLKAHSDKWRSELAERQKQHTESLKTPEEKQREADAEKREHLKTRLFGLEKVYQKYKAYKTLANYTPATGTIGPGIPTYTTPPAQFTKETEAAREELTKDLQKHGFKGGISEFEQHINLLERSFRSETVRIANDLLWQYYDFLDEQEKRFNDPAVIKDLYKRLAPVRSASEEIKKQNKIIDQYNKKKDYGSLPSYGEYGSSSVTQQDADQASVKGKAYLEQAKSATKALSDEYPIFKESHLSQEKRIDKQKMADANEAELKDLILEHIADRKSDVLITLNNIKGDPDLVYKLDSLLTHSFQTQEVTPGSIYESIIKDRISQIKSDEMAVTIALVLFAIVLTVLSFGTGAVAVGAGVGAFGLSSYMAFEEFQEYETQSAAAGSAMLSKDPSLIWVIVSVVGAGLDLGAALKAVKVISVYSKALDAGGSLVEFEAGLKLLEQQGKIDARIADVVIDAAKSREAGNKALKELNHVLTSRMYSFPGPIADPDVYKSIIKLAYYRTKEGVSTFKQFYLEIIQARQAAKLGELSPEELAKLKQAYEEGVNANKTFKTEEEFLKFVEGGKDVTDEVTIALNSASKPYKGSTVLGHALTKHAGRNPHIWGKISGSPSTWHDQGLKHFNDIMNAPGKFSRITTPERINFLEKWLPDGRGMRLNMDGTFKGFID